jgi:hypothetical protein
MAYVKYFDEVNAEKPQDETITLSLGSYSDGPIGIIEGQIRTARTRTSVCPALFYRVLGSYFELGIYA